MTSINTNVSSILARNALVSNERSMSTSMERLSTGFRINGAKDDAAGLAISSKMTSQIRGLNQAVRNANDAVSLIQTAEGALVQTTNMLQRMRELAVQSASDTNVGSDRTALNLEFQQLKAEINRTGDLTQWNGVDILDKSFASSTGTFKFQVGANGAQTIDLSIGDYRGTSGAGSANSSLTQGAAAGTPQKTTITIGGTLAVGDVISVNIGNRSYQHTVSGSTAVADVATALLATIGATPMTGVGATRQDAVITLAATANNTPFEVSSSTGGLLGNITNSVITSQAASDSAIAAIDLALAAVNSGRAEMGAVINRLTYAGDNLAEVSANATESRGRILDADYAKETTELARTQIIAQAGTAMLAQANQVKQTVLSLLK